MAQLLNFVGTGGIIEGNLNDLPVNVNLDPVYELTGNDSEAYFTSSSNQPAKWGTGDFTISAWVYADDYTGSGSQASIFTHGGGSSSDDGARIAVNTSGYIWSTIADGSVRVEQSWDGAGQTDIVELNTWTHVCIAYDRSGSKHLYINGKEQGSGVAITTAALDIANNTRSIFIGSWNATRNFDGKVADVRVYNSLLGQDEVDVLASKIFVDNSVVQATDTRQAHWKLNGVVTDSKGSCTLTAAGSPVPTIVYDAFSVNVQDGLASAGGTTTDGTVTVTQGKLEGKALSYLHLDETADAGVTANAAGAIDDLTALTKGTISLWTRADNLTGGGGSPDDHWVYSLSDESGSSFFGLQTSGWVSPVGRVRCALYSSGSYEWDLSTDAAVTSLDKWHHIVVTQDGSGPVIYVDGVKPPQAFQNSTSVAGWWDDVDNADYQLLGGGLKYGGSAQAYEPDGDFRDYRFYDYALSADQVASLYSGSYNVTPNHHIKFDDVSVGASGSTGNIADSGTDTAWVMTYTSSDTTNDKIVNGTLDLDSSLTIDATGTLSAPRGNLDLAAAFDNSSTIDTGSGKYGFKHNNGRFVLSGGSKAINNNGGSANTAFYELYCSSNSGSRTELFDSMAVEKEFRITGGLFTTRDDTAAPTITMGTSSVAGKINTTVTTDANNGFNVRDKAFIYAADQLKPYTVEGNEWALDEQTCAVSGGLHLKWADFQYALVTDSGQGTNHPTITLDGDCEFDAVTVSSGDTLDLNGQRAEFSDNFLLYGDLDFGSGGIIIATSDFKTYGNIDIDFGSGSTLWMNGTNGKDFLLDVNTGSFSGDLETLMFDCNDATPSAGEGVKILSNIVGSTDSNGVKNVIWAGGTHSSSTSGNIGYDDGGDENVVRPIENLTIPTGGVFAPDDGTINVAGDFTTSGGLIGKSAMLFDGTSDYITKANSDSTFDFTTAMTLEGWVKLDTGDGRTYQHIICKTGGYYYLSVFKVGSEYLAKGLVYEGANIDVTGTTDLNDGKWHHLAVTYSTSAGKLLLYVDGKLEASTDNSDAIAEGTSAALFIGANDAENSNSLDGTLGRVSIWSYALTEAEIRTMMFYDFAAMAADNTVFPDSSRAGGTGVLSTDCKGWWQFDTGTGSTAFDSTTSDNDGTISGAAWAGAGAFTYGTSTLVMAKSGTQYIYGQSGLWLNNLTVNNGSTTKLSFTNDTGGNANHAGNLITVGTGVFESDNNETVYLRNAGDTITVGTAATGIVGIREFITALSGTLTFPTCSIRKLDVNSGDTVQANGDMTFTTELQIDSGTFNANGNTINTAEVDVNDGTLNLTNSTLNFATASQEWNMLAGSTLTTGNTTVTGYSSGNPTQTVLPYTSASSSNFEIVGDVSNLKATLATDLTVIGSVTNCITVGTDAIIRQWHHTLDTQQLLDADSGGDDDLRLTKPALDNSHELQTG